MKKIVLVLTLTIILATYIGLYITKNYKYSTIISTFSFHGSVIKEANGSRIETIKLKDTKNGRLSTEVKLKVEQGDVRLELLDDKAQPTASAVSADGKPASAKGDLVADASGTVKYRIIATKAKKIEYWLTIHH
jgi:hypothetical protein